MNIILFDGICNLCNSAVSFIIKRDRKDLFRFAPIQSETGHALLAQHGMANEPNSTLFYFRNNVCLRQSAAVLYILKDIGRGWKAFYPFICLPTKWRDAVYLLVSRNRYRLFGKRNSCMTPNSEVRNKFL